MEELHEKDVTSIRIVRILDQTKLQDIAAGKLRLFSQFTVKHQTQYVSCVLKMPWVMRAGANQKLACWLSWFLVYTGTCLSYCSIAEKRHHDQGHSENSSFNRGFVYCFRSLVHQHPSRGCGVKAGKHYAGVVTEDYVLIYRQCVCVRVHTHWDIVRQRQRDRHRHRKTNRHIYTHIHKHRKRKRVLACLLA